MTTSQCAICLSTNVNVITRNAGLHQINCPRCGSYEVVSSAAAMLRREEAEGEDVRTWLGPRGSRLRANASAYIRERPGTTIVTADVANLAALKAPGVAERADRLLRELEHIGGGSLGHPIELVAEEGIALTWSADVQELMYLVNLLVDTRRIKEVAISGSSSILEILPAGWEHLERLHETNLRSTQGFIAMSFAQDLTETCEAGIRSAIRAAGYKPHRVDDREHVGRIDDEIIVQLRRSRFVVADFTGHRPGVYYEAGFGHALGLPVFFTLRADAEPLHFDVRQFNTILWKNSDDLRERLSRRIEAELGRGPVEPTGGGSGAAGH